MKRFIPISVIIALLFSFVLVFSLIPKDHASTTDGNPYIHTMYIRVGGQVKASYLTDSETATPYQIIPADIGKSIFFDLVFNEPMNQAIGPLVDNDFNDILTEGESNYLFEYEDELWLNSTTYRFSFKVLNNTSVFKDNLSATITNAQDLGGTTMDAQLFQISDFLTIDTRPKITSYTISDKYISAGDIGKTISFDFYFNTVMDTASIPGLETYLWDNETFQFVSYDFADIFELTFPPLVNITEAWAADGKSFHIEEKILDNEVYYEKLGVYFGDSQDINGNTMVPYSEEIADFVVNTGGPKIVNVNFSDYQIRSEDIGEDKPLLEVKIRYNQEMDPSSVPTAGTDPFGLLEPGNSLYLFKGLESAVSWQENNTVYSASFEILENYNVVAEKIKVEIFGAYDIDGFPQVPYEKEITNFTIDTRPRPRVEEIIFSDKYITASDIGNPLSGDIVFSKLMDHSIEPSLSFSYYDQLEKRIVTTDFLDFFEVTDYGWQDNENKSILHYEGTINDLEVYYTDLKIEVSGARDATEDNNPLIPYPEDPEYLEDFIINTVAPEVTEIIVKVGQEVISNDFMITADDIGKDVSMEIVYSKLMNHLTVPDILTEPAELFEVNLDDKLNPVGNYLIDVDIYWGDDEKIGWINHETYSSFLITTKILNNPNVVVAEVTSQITDDRFSAKDLDGNIQIPYELVKIFSIDTKAPIAPYIEEFYYSDPYITASDIGKEITFTMKFNKKMNIDRLMLLEVGILDSETGLESEEVIEDFAEITFPVWPDYQSGWESDQQTYKIKYRILDNKNIFIDRFFFKVSEGKDIKGNKMEPFYFDSQESEQLLIFNTRSPEVVSITLSDNTITVADFGKEIKLTIEFDREMDPKSYPEIGNVYANGDLYDPTDWLKYKSGKWITANKFQYTYEIIKTKEFNFETISIEINGAKSAQGYEQIPYPEPDKEVASGVIEGLTINTAPILLECEAAGNQRIKWRLTTTTENLYVTKYFDLISSDEEKKVFEIETNLREIERIEASLQPNTNYQRYFKVNIGGQISTSQIKGCFTLANPPLPPLVTKITEEDNLYKVVIDRNDGNPDWTEYALQETSSGEYIQEDGSLNSHIVWQTYDDWGGEQGVEVSLEEAVARNTQTFRIALESDSGFKSLVRNGDGVVIEQQAETEPIIEATPIFPDVKATKLVAVNVEEPLVNNIAQPALAANFTQLPSISFIILVRELFVFTGLFIIILLVFSVISLQIALKNLKQKINHGFLNHLRLFAQLLYQDTSAIFYTNALQDKKGTFKVSYNNYRKYHLFARKNIKRIAALLLVEVLILCVIFINFQNLSLAQETNFDQDGTQVEVGDILNYKIEFSNLGADDAENLMIADQLSQDLEYQADSAELVIAEAVQTLDFTQTDNLLTFNIGELKQGHAGYLLFKAKVLESAAEKEINNQAEIKGDNFSGFLTNQTNNPVAEILIVEEPEKKPEIANKPPTVTDDRAETEQNMSVEISILVNDSDPDNGLNPQSLKIVNPPKEGKVSMIDGKVLYQPDKDYTGEDLFTYVICDFLGACDDAQVMVLVKLGEIIDESIEDDKEEKTGSQETDKKANVITSIIKSRSVKALQEKVLDNPVVEEVSQDVVTPALVTISVVNTVPSTAAVAVNLWSYLRFLFLEPFAFLFRKKRKKWGVVYDSLTKMPIGLAVVRLYSQKDDKLIQTKVTDREGRYLMIIKDPGKYYLRVNKPEYIFPTIFLKDKVQDTQYTDIYHGGGIEVSSEKGVLTLNIPLDHQEEKKKPLKNTIRDSVFKNLRLILTYIGLVISLLIFIISPSLITIVSIVIHIILYISFHRLLAAKKIKNWGVVFDQATKKPLHFAVVRIFDTKFNKLLETQVTDRKGRYSFLVGSNIYQLSVEKQGYKKKNIKEVDLSSGEPIINMDIGLKKQSAPEKPQKPLKTAENNKK